MNAEELMKEFVELLKENDIDFPVIFSCSDRDEASNEGVHAIIGGGSFSDRVFGDMILTLSGHINQSTRKTAGKVSIQMNSDSLETILENVDKMYDDTRNSD